MSNGARQAGDFAASNRALELLGKTDELRLFVERSESKITASMAITTVVDRPPAETREQWLDRRRRELTLHQPVGNA